MPSNRKLRNRGRKGKMPLLLFGRLWYNQIMQLTQPIQLDKLLDPLARSLTPELAKILVDLDVDPSVRERSQYLAERANEGLLTEEEGIEYDRYIEAMDLIGILQSKAWSVIARC